MLYGKLIEEHVDTFKEILEENPYVAEESHRMSNMALLCAAETTLVEENSVSGDIAGYDKFLFKLVERGYPAVIGLDIFGVQMMDGPTGMIFSLWRSYAGDDLAPGTVKKSDGVILVVDNATVFTAQNDIITNSTTGATGSVVLVDGFKLLVKITGAGGWNATDVVTDGVTSINVVIADDNVLGYKHVFTDQAKFSSVYAGEIASTNIKQITINIEKLTAVAETFKMKAKYTEEMRQDLAKLHRKDASNIFAGVASQEFALELNAQLLQVMKVRAGEGGTLAYDYASAIGMSQKQKIESLVATIARATGQIAKSSMMGFANWAVMDVETFMTLFIMGFVDKSMLPNKILDPTLNAFVGVLVGQWRVYIDLFEDDTVIYLGYKDLSGRPEAEWKAGIYFCPYIPVESIEVRDPESGQPRLIFTTRYALVENPFGAKNFYRKITVANLPA